MSENKDLFYYKLRCINPIQYSLIIRFKTRNKLLMTIFQKAKKKVEKKKGIKIDGDLDKIEAFKVDDKYLNLINTITKKQFKKVKDKAEQDKIILINHHTDETRFKRENGEIWLIEITISGDYIDKR